MGGNKLVSDSLDYYSVCVCVCVCAYTHLCACMKERERRRKRERVLEVTIIFLMAFNSAKNNEFL